MDYLDMAINRLSNSPNIKEGEVWDNLRKDKDVKVVETKVEAKQTKMDGIAEFFSCMGMFSKAEEIQLEAGKDKNRKATCPGLHCHHCGLDECLNKRMTIMCVNCHKDFMPVIKKGGLVRCTNCCYEQLPF